MSGSDKDAAEKNGGNAFTFSSDGGMNQGLRTLAMMWATPWRAAFIVANEAMREGFGPTK